MKVKLYTQINAPDRDLARIRLAARRIGGKLIGRQTWILPDADIGDTAQVLADDAQVYVMVSTPVITSGRLPGTDGRHGRGPRDGFLR